MELNAVTIEMLKDGTIETLYMVALSSALSYLIGIPLGILLIVTDKDGIRPVPAFNRILGLVINLLRSIPFIILLIMILPLTKLIVGKVTGANAVVVPLVLSASPYIARMVESSLKEVNAGVIEAAQDLGANSQQVFRKVIFPLSLPGVLSGVTMVFIPSVSTFVISRLLGGGTTILLGDLIEMQFLGNAYNPHLGSAISLVMMVIVLVCMGIMNRFGEGEGEAVLL